MPDEHVSMTKGSVDVPPWVLGVMLLTGGGLGGAGIHATTADSPAVLEQRMDDLGEKIIESRTASQKANDEMKVTISDLQKSVSSAGFDRFRRSDHEIWLSKDFEPLEKRLSEHIAEEGHGPTMRIVDRHEGEIRSLSLIVRDLQSAKSREDREERDRR